jgi:uncharacterized alpha-E superfamily protein
VVVTLHQGGATKDAWVQSGSRSDVQTPSVATEEALELSRGSGELSSRLADEMFWLGRYVERAEARVRLLRALVERTMDDNRIGPEVPLLMRALVGKAVEGSAEVTRSELLSFVFDTERAGGLVKTLLSIDAVSASVRDRLSFDAWRILATVIEDVTRPSGPHHLTDVLVLANRLVLSLAAFSGLAYENTTRGQGLRFLDMGKRLERALHTLGLVEATLVLPCAPESRVLEALLEVGDSLMTYRQRYLTSLQASGVLDLLIADETNPRSVAFQLAVLAKHMPRLPQSEADKAQLPVEQRIILGNLTDVRLMNMQDLVRCDAAGDRTHLRDYCRRLIEELPTVSDVIGQRYMSHAPIPRHIASLDVPVTFSVGGYRDL